MGSKALWERSLLDLMDLTLEAPDHTTLSRRSRNLRVEIELANSKEPVHLIIDSTGLSIVGEGEWAAAKHGGRGKRGWRKLHIGVDRSGQVLAQVLTDSSGDDANTGLGIIEATKGKLASVTGDAAYDTVAIYKKAAARGARVVIPPSRSASVSSRNENAFFRYKTVFGDRMRSRGADAQAAEARLACNMLNRLTELGRSESYAMLVSNGTSVFSRPGQKAQHLAFV